MPLEVYSERPQDRLTPDEWRKRATFAHESDSTGARLPPPAREKLDALRRDHAYARMQASGPRERLEELRDKMSRVEVSLDNLRRGNFPNDHALVLAERESVATLRAEINVVNGDRSAINQTAGELGTLIARVEAYVKGLSASVLIHAHSPVEPKLGMGEPVSAAIGRIRESIVAVGDEIQATIDAPITSAAAKKLARTWVDHLAARGAPNVATTIHHGERPRFVDAPRGANGIDVEATLAWLHKAALGAALEREIDAQADDASALTDEARAARLQKHKARLLLLERDEEALIELAWSQGVMIARRTDADPRAVLGLGDDMPPPADM